MKVIFIKWIYLMVIFIYWVDIKKKSMKVKGIIYIRLNF